MTAPGDFWEKAEQHGANAQKATTANELGKMRRGMAFILPTSSTPV